ncbi:MAG: NAD(P)/FAD-dependent oxidoreductase [Bacteroidia bacterium]|nr:NAD(P)/FAD-dependent oxidoreductase [Bacteroidia bacterium]
MNYDADVAVIGSGMAGLTAAVLLAKEGKKVLLLEQNWLAGGCSSSYPRKNYVFESGATTLVGLDPHMPLEFLERETGIKLNPWELSIPMKVYLKNGEVLTRYKNLDQWIAEAERVFGSKGQAAFWKECYKIAHFVWETSLVQRAFPPSSVKDLIYAATHFQPKQLGFAAKAFVSVEDLLKKYGLFENELFKEFVNEQLLITAQNYLEEVNILFGATALCYTNFTNYYMPGGLGKMVDILVGYVEQHGGKLLTRTPVSQILPQNDHYKLKSNYRGEEQEFLVRNVVSSIPINNSLELLDNDLFNKKYQKKILRSDKLNSAFQMGFVITRKENVDCLHHQIHLDEALPYAGSHSIFLSWSHPDDGERCGPDELVGSISTHVPDPARNFVEKKEKIEETIWRNLERVGLAMKKDVVYQHSSTPGSWEKWTKRSWGFVGGYPQYMKIKPWQMLDARFDGKGMYICGDSTYPGQGIPGACLSGIVAVEKMKLDGVLKKK